MSLFRHFASGEWYLSDLGPAALTAQPTLNRMYLAPFSVAEVTASFKTIGIAVTSGGANPINVRAGIYSNTASNNLWPNALITEWDTSAWDLTTTGQKTLAVTLNLSPGLYWLATCCQGGGTRPTCAVITPNYAPGIPVTSLTTATSAGKSLRAAGVTDALPATASGATWVWDNILALYLQAA